MTVYEALQKIIDNRNEKVLNYAVDYAQHGLTIPEQNIEELRVQVLYVLNNITRWQGTEAKEVRNRLKAFVGLRRR